jgi:hypothetical protein
LNHPKLPYIIYYYILIGGKIMTVKQYADFASRMKNSYNIIEMVFPSNKYK